MRVTSAARASSPIWIGTEPPRRWLRLNASVPPGHHFLLPLVPAFLRRYPDFNLDIVLTDKIIDLPEQRTDVAIRIGPLKYSNPIAYKPGQMRTMIVGSPAYLRATARRSARTNGNSTI
ncbi:hypothetical protein FJU30_14190 [Affinibrenneria salicis]|uniref:LysR substrate-binding domain-containing protein n=1 Tax=Affinibrenneria salicis TaxID=2590031 RepID=A0A5J5FY07_9GAMM|nr:LysR substrate-binding domain-containing protein [Affinibrenneria salicis]KAA8998839.1 hypothetical protein FJU30_14190 [Affinibrenneria salicis]